MAGSSQGRDEQEMEILPTYNQPKPPSSTYNPANPNRSGLGPAPPGMDLPGVLQTGRPGAVESNTAPASIPTLPSISTQQMQYSSPSRSSTTGHSYSHSSPAPTYSDSASTPTHQKYLTLNTNPNVAYSPLGLADIRPRADSTNDEGLMTPNPLLARPSVPTNCNYLASWAVYSLDWCKWPAHNQGLGDSAGKMAIGSYSEEGANCIQILDTQIVPDSEMDQDSSSPQYGIEYTKTAEAAHSYPVTRMLWEPESAGKQTCDLLATSGDHLRLWSLPSGKQTNQSNSITRPTNIGDQNQVAKLQALALLSNSKSPEYTAPLTSLDWNTLSPSLIITSSIDTTCTIWDIPSLTAKTQLIAHDKEVFDVRFCANSVDVFVSCGADGSVRMFDLRSLEHSTIIYEPSDKLDKSGNGGDVSPTKAQQTMSHPPPLLRLAASPHDAHLLATFSQDSSIIRILDVRQPGQALLELHGHRAPLNCIEWSPTRRGTLASGADDSLVLVWDLVNQTSATAVNGGQNQGQAQINIPDNARGPMASWLCDYEVNNISWAPKSGLTGGTGQTGREWLGVSGGCGVWGVAL